MPSATSSPVVRALGWRPVLGDLRRLSYLDEVAVRVADVAADLTAAVDRRGQKLGPAPAPRFVYGVDVGDPDIEKGADPVKIGRRLERYRWFVVRRSAADVDDDPPVRQGDDRGLALEHGFASEDLGVETPRALDVARDDEVGQHDLFCWR